MQSGDDYTLVLVFYLDMMAVALHLSPLASMYVHFSVELYL